MKKRLLFLFIIVGVIFCLFSCNEERYVVTFDPNGAEMATEQIEVEYGGMYMLPIPYRLGYEFLGWYDADQRVDDQGTWKLEKDVELVAKWKFLEFKINCDVNNDGAFDREYAYNSLTETFDIEAPQEAGKIFSHWVDENGKIYESDLSIPKGSEGNYNLTAVWWNYIYNDVVYEYNGETLCVIGYIGNCHKDIYIPSEILGKAVVGIKAGAFEGLENKAIPLGFISRIVITRSITYIGDNAFNKCKNIKVILLTNNDEDAIKETGKWLQSVVISPVGNDDLVDVLLLKRPAIGASLYQKIEE